VSTRAWLLRHSPQYLKLTRRKATPLSIALLLLATTVPGQQLRQPAATDALARQAAIGILLRAERSYALLDTPVDMQAWHLAAEATHDSPIGLSLGQRHYEIFWGGPGKVELISTGDGIEEKFWESIDRRFITDDLPPIPDTASESPVSMPAGSSGDWNTRHNLLMNASLNLLDKLLNPIPFYTLDALEKWPVVAVVPSENGDHEQCARYGVKTPLRSGGSDQRPPLETTETVCIDEDTGALRRVMHSVGSISVLTSSTSYDDIIPFQGRFLARHIRSTRNGKLVLEINISKADVVPQLAGADYMPTRKTLRWHIMPDPPSAHVMVASVRSPMFVGCSRSPANAVAPEVATEHLLKETVEPGTQAKNQPVKGGVVLLLTIGPDGQVLDDKVLSTPDPIQTQTAEHSIASWKYRPFVMGNTAGCAETTAFVAFSPNK
jgi:hypothetical protein